jgi:hypothetical protein
LRWAAKGKQEEAGRPILRNACNGNGGEAGTGVEGGQTEIGGEIDAAADPLPSSGSEAGRRRHHTHTVAVLCCATKGQ